MDDCLPKPFDAAALNAVLVRSSRKAAEERAELSRSA
jgi:hypothetical protein